MKTVLNVKTDKDVKERAQALAKHLGIPLSIVVNAYLKDFIYSGEFRVTREPELRPEVAKRLLKQMQEAKDGKNISPAFHSIEEVKAYLGV